MRPPWWHLWAEAVSGGGPGVAWFPLAPREVYVPWYRTSRGYVNNVNITNTRVNVTQVTNVYNVYNSQPRNVTRITYVNQRGDQWRHGGFARHVRERPSGITKHGTLGCAADR